MKHMVKYVVIVVCILLMIVVVFGLSIVITGRGTVEKFKDDNGKVLEGSIAEKLFLDVHGQKNGMIIRGKDTNNPVLLFISGGPGVPEYWLNEYMENKLEEQYTVCWWEWLGEGMSYDASIHSEDITLERLQSDAVEVARYLKERFGKDKIYLMAHSGGTPLGLRLAQSNQDEFYCYFSMGQLVNEGNLRYSAGYTYLKQYYQETNNKSALKKLNSLMKQGDDGSYQPVNEKTIAGKWEGLLLKAGCGTTRTMTSDAFGIFFPQIYSKCYTAIEKINFWKGKALNTGTPYSNVQISTQESESKIPVYFISGRYDYTCPVTLVEELYRNLVAPDKGMYTLENSAHSPLWEENEAVLNVMKSITDQYER